MNFALHCYSKNHLSPVKYHNSIHFKATMRSLNNNHVLSRSSVQVQRAVQCKPAFVQEHLPWHPFLYPRLTSSWHDFVTSGIVVQTGFQMPSSIVHPHSCGLGNTGLGTSACPQQCPAWYAVHLTCSTESSEHNWANISEKICPEMLVFGKWAFWMLFFQKILTNPIISLI